MTTEAGGKAAKKAASKRRKKQKLSETNEDSVGGGKTQTRLPGQGRVRDETLEKLSDKVDDLQSKRISAQEKENEARQELTDYMVTHKIKKYDLPGNREAIIPDNKPKALVHKKKEEE